MNELKTAKIFKFCYGAIRGFVKHKKWAIITRKSERV